MPFKVTADYLAAVTLKVLSSVLTVALALAGYGCGADRVPSTPVSPSPSPTMPGPPPAPPVAGELWRLTTTVVSLEGSACFWTHPVGMKWENWTLSVERSGAQVRLIYDVNNPHDNVLFVGAVNEQSFTAVSDNYRGFWPCAGTVTISSSVVGSFSSDDRTLSGRERLIYRVDGGSELIIAFGVERHAHMSSPRLG
jgi:hypothetical protein